MVSFSWLQPWLYLLPVVLVPGLLNAPAAFVQLDKKCNAQPLFNPWLSLFVWIWTLINLLVPILPFWFLCCLASKPELNFELFAKAITFGFLFQGFVSARDLGLFGLDVGYVYGALAQVIASQIADRQTRKTTDFWFDLRDEFLTLSSSHWGRGLNYLDSYFGDDKLARTPEQREAYRQRIDAASQLPSDQKIKAVKALLQEVRRKDLRPTLEKFGCKPTTLQQLFSKK
jgi:hypothetical protein